MWRAVQLQSSSRAFVAGVALENGDVELQLNPSCLRYLSEINNLYGVEARGRLVASSVGLRAFGPVSGGGTTFVDEPRSRFCNDKSHAFASCTV